MDITKNIPDIFNSDQGNHFTSPKFIKISEDNKIKISMDGRGRYLDNIFVERLWRSVKQENIYLNDYTDVRETKIGLKQYFDFYPIKFCRAKILSKTKLFYPVKYLRSKFNPVK